MSVTCQIGSLLFSFKVFAKHFCSYVPLQSLLRADKEAHKLWWRKLKIRLGVEKKQFCYGSRQLF